MESLWIDTDRVKLMYGGTVQAVLLPLGTGFSLSTSVFVCQYHSAKAPYFALHEKHRQYNK